MDSHATKRIIIIFLINFDVMVERLDEYFK